MSVYISGLEGTNGQPVTAANHGGNAFEFVVGTLLFTNARAAHGSTSVVATASGRLQWDIPDEATVATLRAYIYSTQATTGDTTLGYFLNTTTGGDKPAQLILNSANKFRVQTWDEAGVLTARWSGANNGTGQTSSTITCPLNQWIRWELYCNLVTGEVWAAIFAGDATQPLETTGVIAGLDLRGSALSSASVVVNAPSTNSNLTVDDPGLKTGNDASKAAFPVGNVPPSLTMPAPLHVAGGSSVTVTANASDPDGAGALTYAWTVDGYWGAAAAPTTAGLQNANTKDVTFTAPAAGTSGAITRLKVVVSDGSASTSGTVEVRSVVPAGTNARPALMDAISEVGTWNRVGGSATDGHALADDTTATYMESGTLSSTVQSLGIRMGPMAARGLDHGASIQAGTDVGTGNMTVRLYAPNGTQRQSFTAALTTTANHFNFEPSDAVINAMTQEAWGFYVLVMEVTS